jgi:hypothetical protein
MLEYVLVTLGGALATYLGERYLYKRKIVKRVIELAAEHGPDGNVAELAERAVIGANVTEARAAIKAAELARAEHEARMAAIRAGAAEVNVGSFRK